MQRPDKSRSEKYDFIFSKYFSTRENDFSSVDGVQGDGAACSRKSSIINSSLTSNLVPLSVKHLMPLSVCGLWDAVIMIPKSALCSSKP